jgi:3-dehydroquinate dehydratase
VEQELRSLREMQVAVAQTSREQELINEIEHMREQNERQVQLIHKLLGQPKTPRSEKN